MNTLVTALFTISAYYYWPTGKTQILAVINGYDIRVYEVKDGYRTKMIVGPTERDFQRMKKEPQK